MKIQRIARAVFVAILLSGCTAPKTFSGTCALKPLGTNESGLMFALVHCEAKDAAQ